MPLSLRTVAHSEIGLVRKNNQDSGYASPTMLVVADGMGGAAAGDLASTVAVAELQRADGRYHGNEMLQVLAATLQRANDRLAELVADDLTLDGMGTTVCGALFDGEQLGVVHIGDSRGYLRRDGVLRRITHDHSWVQSLVDDGRITEAESLYHPHRSLLLKVLNGQPIAEPDLELVKVEAGDRLLFCSDGLCGLVTDDVINAALGVDDRELALRDLIEAAHLGGGLDNITIIVSDVVEEDEAPPPAAEAEETTPHDDDVESTILVPGRSIAAGLLLGAAVHREIPSIRHRPVEIGVSPPDRDFATDDSGNPLPDAPAPARVDRLVAASDDEPPRRAIATKRRGRGLAIVIAALVLALAGSGFGTYAYAQTQYFVAPNAGTVGVYRGFDLAVAGRPLNSLYQATAIPVQELPPQTRIAVMNHYKVDGGEPRVDDAVLTLQLLRDQCQAIKETRQTATPTPSPAATETPTPSTATGAENTPGTRSASPTGRATTSTSATPTALPTSATPVVSQTSSMTPTPTPTPGPELAGC